LKPIEEQLKKEIKERKLADIELAQVKNRLEYLLINNPAVIYTSKVDDDWSATFISKNIKKQLGYNPKDFLEDSKFWISHIHPDDRKRVKKDIMKIFETDIYDHEYRFQKKDGTYAWMHDEFRLMRDKDGKPVECIGFWVDITDRKRIELELDNYRDHLEELVQARTNDLQNTNIQLKQEINERIKVEQELKNKTIEEENARKKAEIYLDFLVHDIANLFSPIMSYAEIIASNQEIPGELQKYAINIVNQTQYAATFISNLRKLSEAERIAPSEDAIQDVRDFLSENETAIIKGYPNKKFEFIHDAMPDEPVSVYGGEYISDIILAIFDNSAQFVDKDEVKIEINISAKDDSDNNSFWEISISYESPGMQDTLKESLLNPFNYSNRLRRGVFSSLAFSSLIARHFGGELRIENVSPDDLKEGVRFLLILPKAFE